MADEWQMNGSISKTTNLVQACLSAKFLAVKFNFIFIIIFIWSTIHMAQTGRHLYIMLNNYLIMVFHNFKSLGCYP